MARTVEEVATRKDIPHRLSEYVPIVAWLPRYESGWLRFDLLAGLTAAAVVIPQAKETILYLFGQAELALFSIIGYDVTNVTCNVSDISRIGD